jgi:hypothetical protein
VIAHHFIALSLEGIVHEIHEHLLNLDLVHGHGRQRIVQIEFQPPVMHAGVGGQQRVHLADEAVDVLGFAPDVLVTDQRTDTADDFPGAQGLSGNLFQRATDFRQVRRRQAQQPHAGLRVVGDGRQGLVELVRNAGRHLAHGGQARYAVHALQCAMRFHFRAFLFGDVLAGKHDPGGDIAGVAQCDPPPGDEPVFPVR